jgi:hypothetical protein
LSEMKEDAIVEETVHGEFIVFFVRNEKSELFVRKRRKREASKRAFVLYQNSVGLYVK